MATIKRIDFSTVSTNEGCRCDRCGQWIKNIWTVTYKEGFSLHYGLDCWEKIYKHSNLSKQGEKLLRKHMKSIESYQKAMQRQAELTEETDEAWKISQAEWNKNNAWYGEKYEDYKKWMLEEFFPYRIQHEQDEIELRFKKVVFKEIPVESEVG